MLRFMYVHTVTQVCLAYLRAGQIASVTSGPMPPEYCLPEAGRHHRDNTDHLQTRAHFELEKALQCMWVLAQVQQKSCHQACRLRYQSQAYIAALV